MSSTQLVNWGRTGTGALALLLLAMPVIGQAPADRDYLDQAKRLQAIAAQRLEDEVRAALTESQKLSASNAAAAVDLLKQVLAKLEADTALSAARRESLKRILQDRIRNTTVDAVRNPEPTPPRTPAPAAAPASKGTGKPTLEEHQEVQQILSVIAQLRKERQFAEADRLAAELARNYPNHPAAQAAARTGQTGTSVNNQRGQQGDNEKRVAGVLQGVERSAAPSSGEVEFPKDFQQRTAGRKTTVVLTTREKAILKGLATPISAPLRFQDSRFEDVIEYFATLTGQPIVLDKLALDDAQVGYDTPITANFPKGVTVRTILRSILGQFGLTYIVKDETIQVVSTLKAQQTLVTRTYYLGDLLEVNNFGGPPITPGMAQVQMAQVAQQIIDSITNTIDPDTWKVNGGHGTIFFHAPTRSLVVRQSAEVHAMLSGGGR
jgi:hypothetical protein